MSLLLLVLVSLGILQADGVDVQHFGHGLDSRRSLLSTRDHSESDDSFVNSWCISLNPFIKNARRCGCKEGPTPPVKGGACCSMVAYRDGEDCNGHGTCVAYQPSVEELKAMKKNKYIGEFLQIEEYQNFDDVLQEGAGEHGDLGHERGASTDHHRSSLRPHAAAIKLRSPYSVHNDDSNDTLDTGLHAQEKIRHRAADLSGPAVLKDHDSSRDADASNSISEDESHHQHEWALHIDSLPSKSGLQRSLSSNHRSHSEVTQYSENRARHNHPQSRNRRLRREHVFEALKLSPVTSPALKQIVNHTHATVICARQGSPLYSNFSYKPSDGWNNSRLVLQNYSRVNCAGLQDTGTVASRLLSLFQQWLSPATGSGHVRPTDVTLSSDDIDGEDYVASVHSAVAALLEVASRERASSFTGSTSGGRSQMLLSQKLNHLLSSADDIAVHAASAGAIKNHYVGYGQTKSMFKNYVVFTEVCLECPRACLLASRQLM